MVLWRLNLEELLFGASFIRLMVGYSENGNGWQYDYDFLHVAIIINM